MKPSEAIKTLGRLAKREDADLYVFNAIIWADNVDRFRALICDKQQRRKNVIVFLTTPGGDPDAAYRLAACLKRHYTSTRFYILGPCKSAGTLALLGANEIVFGDLGELGPLDVQLAKPDEIVPASSGLDIFQALAVITNSAFEAWERYFLNIVERSQGNISAKTAAEIASKLAVGLFGPMTGQIDPERLGEVQRAINIATAYGSRLNRGNLKHGALEKLVQGYPTHGFVIDLEEAITIFNKVRKTDQLERQAETILPFCRKISKEAVIGDLVNMFTGTQPGGGKPHAKKPKAKPQAKKAPASAESGSGTRSGNVAQLR